MKCADCGSELVAEPGTFIGLAALAAQTRVLDGNVEETAEETREWHARMDRVTGTFVILAGLGITVATYVLALNGGIYLIAWGPIVYGTLRLLRGLTPARKT